MKSIMRGVVGALILFVALPVVAKPVSLFFGDINKMPYAWDASALDAITFNEAIFDRLINVDPDFRLKPGLLKRFYFDQNLKGYVLELSSGLKFSNGRPANAHDLEFSILRGFFSRLPNFFRIYFANIDGATSIKAGTPYQSGVVSGIKLIGETKILIRLKKPNPAFLHSLSNMVLRLVPKEELTEDLFSWKAYPVGAGPYVVKSTDENKFIVRIQSKTQSTKEFELLYARANAKPDISFVEQPGYEPIKFTRPSSVTAVLFSKKSALGRDAKFRKAFSAALNNSTQSAAHLESAQELLPPAFWGRTLSKRETHQITSFTGKTIRGRVLNLAAKPSPSKLSLVEAIQNTIAKLNAQAVVDYTKSKFLTGPGDDSADLFGISILADYFDPLLMFSTFGPDSPTEAISLTGDDKFMALFDKATLAEDFEERIATVQSLSQYIVDEAYAVPINYEFATAFYNPKTISSIGQVNVPNLIHLDQVKAKE